MELTQLGEEYRRSADQITELIRKYTGEMHKADKNGDNNRVYRLKRTLCDLYNQREHLQDIACHLIHYYDIH